MITDDDRAYVAKKIGEWVATLEAEGLADKPIMSCACGQCPNGVVTPRSVLRDIENRTEEGERFVESWVDLNVRGILK
jgi:hypothetical protein